MIDEAWVLGFGATLERLHPGPGQWLVPDVVAPSGDLTGKGQKIVVVDTGVLRDHPLLLGRVVDEVDLTGEGVDDKNGHGTSVAAIAAATAPDAQLISVKAVGLTGRVPVDVLAQGIREAGRLLGGGGTINVSVGRPDPTCTGECPLCQATAAVQEVPGVILLGAAGNTEGPTYCPARAGIAVETPEPGDAQGEVTAEPPGWKLIDQRSN